MTRLLPLAGLLVALPCLAFAQGATATTAPAAKPPSAAQAAQQQRMTTCNATATERHLAGSARKDFMSACLADKQTPQLMMKVCNAEATSEKMTADARKAYVTSCLKTS